MNVFSKEDVKIDFSARLNRFSISKKDEWISISPCAFKMMVALTDVGSDYERINVHQNGSEVEILKLYSNYVLTFNCKSIRSSIVLPSTIIQSISQNYKNINDKLLNYKSNLTSQPNFIKPIFARKRKILSEESPMKFQKKKINDDQENNNSNNDNVKSIYTKD